MQYIIILIVSVCDIKTLLFYYTIWDVILNNNNNKNNKLQFVEHNIGYKICLVY